jgi:phytoene dehydrogenase-like protein
VTPEAAAPDAIVIGAGPNGLVAANHLADRGWSVLVLEANDEPGGAVRSGELTIPGYTHDLFSAFYPLAVASPAIVALGLERHGLVWRRSPQVLAHPFLDGRCAVLSTDLAATARSLEAFAAGDGDRWREMIGEWERVRGPLLDAILGPFPPLRPAARLLRRLGSRGAVRFARQAVLPVRRLAEERFEGEGAAMLLGGCALHADLTPEAAGSGIYGWLLACLGQSFGYPVPEGGAGMLTRSLVRRLEAAGGRVQCSTRVTGVTVRAGRAVGVVTADGTAIPAGRAVLADTPAPTLYLDLLERDLVPEHVLADMERFQWDTATVKVDWALERPIPWAAPEAADAGTVHVADDFANLTEFSAHLAMERLPSRPFLLMGQQSRADPTRAPEGRETAWAYTHVPRRVLADAAGKIDVGPDGAQGRWLPAFVDRIESRVEALAPGFKASILGRHLFGPADLEAADANLVGGAIGGGTAQIHQQLIFRPVPGNGRPTTPIAGLYLASSSAHPGGGVHGAAGANAARAALSATTFRRRGQGR